jgi:hypothetical protein
MLGWFNATPAAQAIEATIAEYPVAEVLEATTTESQHRTLREPQGTESPVAEALEATSSKSHHLTLREPQGTECPAAKVLEAIFPVFASGCAFNSRDAIFDRPARN